MNPASTCPKPLPRSSRMCWNCHRRVRRRSVRPRHLRRHCAASDPELSVALDDDPAGIGRKSKYRVIYLLRDDAGDLDKVILPLHGYGLWSTLYGFIALENNGNDIFGLQFYQHGETPGLGAEVDNPRWKALWNGKKLRDDAGDLQITVAKSQPAAGPDFMSMRWPAPR